MSSPSKSLVLTPEVAQRIITEQHANASQNSMSLRSRNSVFPQDSSRSTLPLPMEQMSAANSPRGDVASFPFHTRRPPEYSQVGYPNDHFGLINNAAPMATNNTSSVPNLPAINSPFSSHNGNIFAPRTPAIQIQDEFMSVTQAYLRQSVQWSPAECVREFPTNAFGKVDLREMRIYSE